jgi:hypothetical protein
VQITTASKALAVAAQDQLAIAAGPAALLASVSALAAGGTEVQADLGLEINPAPSYVPDAKVEPGPLPAGLLVLSPVKKAVVSSIEFSPDGSLLAAGDAAGQARIFTHGG